MPADYAEEKECGRFMSMQGIDVSSYQKKPDWSAVGADGVRFAILRTMDSKGKDHSFEHNYSGSGAAGILRGVYRFSYALTEAQARSEAEGVLTALAGRKLEMGVWLDLEWNRQRALGKKKVKKLADTWMKTIRNGGYECGIYCNKDWYANVCSGLDAKYWIARYPAADNGTLKEGLRPHVGEVGWQYSRKGKLPGITGDVDLDIWYADQDANQRNPYREPVKILRYQRLLVGIVQEGVKWLQWELREAGYDIMLDGKFGPATDLALRAFQKTHPKTYSGKEPDGVCGAKTREALKAAEG